MPIKHILYLSLFFIQFCSYQNTEPSSKKEPDDIYHALDLLSSSISQKLENYNIKTLAIMKYIDLSEKNNTIGSYISDEIILQLFLKETFQIIEREQIDYIINEQKLSSSGLIDEKSIIELGNILSVDAIVLGNISEINNNIIINTKIISSGTGEIIFVDKISLLKSDEFKIITQNSPNSQDLSDEDTFSSSNSKTYKQSIRKLSKNLLTCLENNNYKCYLKFIATKDQLRKIFLIQYRENKSLRKQKTLNLNIEFKEYKKKYKQNFLNILKHLEKRNINWNNVKIEKINLKVIKNYDQKKLFGIDLILNEGQKHIHIFYKAFMLNGKWIINDIEIKRKK